MTSTSAGPNQKLIDAFLREDFGQVGVYLAQAKQNVGEGLLTALVAQLWKQSCHHPFSPTQTAILGQFYPIGQAVIFGGMLDDNDWVGMYQHNPGLFEDCGKRMSNQFGMLKAMMRCAQSPADFAVIENLNKLVFFEKRQEREGRFPRGTASTLMFVQALMAGNGKTAQWLLANGGDWLGWAEAVGQAFSLRAHPENLNRKLDLIVSTIAEQKEISWPVVEGELGMEATKVIRSGWEKTRLEQILPRGNDQPTRRATL